MRRVFHPETNGVKASPHRHKRVLSHGAPADPSDPWNIHAAPVSPRQNGSACKAPVTAAERMRRLRARRRNGLRSLRVLLTETEIDSLVDKGLWFAIGALVAVSLI